jgi:macrolide-specific efflux system membrane fusion protein
MKKIAFVCALLLAGYFGWRHWKGASGNGHAAEPTYEAAPLIRTNLISVIESTGVVEPRNRLEIKPPIAGRIEDVLVVEGQAVKRGDIMAWLSSTERATLLDSARAKDDATARKWEEVYRATPLIAPLEATVIARATEPGQTVTAADTVLVLSDRLIVRAQVDETDIGRIRTGMTARIQLDAYADVAVEAVVRHIAFEATTVNNVTIYEVEVEPAQIPEFMKSGMTATVGFRMEESGEAWAVPVAAVRVNEQGPAVLRSSGRPKDEPREQPVSTGLSVRGWVVITEGLKGDESLVQPTFRLPEGRKETGSPFIPARPGGMRPRP